MLLANKDLSETSVSLHNLTHSQLSIYMNLRVDSYPTAVAFEFC